MKPIPIRFLFLAALLCAALPLPAQEARPTLQILNGSQQTLDVFWLKSDAERVANGSIAPGKDTTITTTRGHRFALVGREGHTEFTVTSKVPVQGVRFDPPSADGVPAFYTQAVSADGFPIVASAKVNPYALKEAAFLVNLMLAQRPDVRAALIQSGARMCIMAHDEFTTDLPEFTHLGQTKITSVGGLDGKTFWDARARGTGGSQSDPFCTSAEENLLGFPGDPYAAECILIHEFAHCIHLRGMVNVDPTFDARLRETYERAMKAGLWKGKYASVNHHEYFAEGVQSWFDNNRVNDHDHNHVNTRALLLEYDPGLAAMCREVFGDTAIKYTKPATRLTAHMAGYDPAKAPTFVWPERLAKAKAEIRAQALARSEAANAPAPPRDAVPLDAAEVPLNYRLHVEFFAPAGGAVRLGKEFVVPLAKGAEHDVAVEYPAKGAPVLRVWSDGKLVRGPEEIAALVQNGAQDFPEAKLDLGGDFTAVVKFETSGGGTLFSKCAPTGKWVADAKALFIRGGRLVYDIGWLGAMTGGGAVDDGKPHTAVLTLRSGTARLWLDGKVIAEKAALTKPDVAGHVFKVGRAAPDFAGDFAKGKIAGVRVWSRAMPDAEVALLFKADGAGANTPDFTHTPTSGGARPSIEPAAGVTVRAAWMQALERSDHAEIVAGWNDKTLAEGAEIYKTLCVVCHGTKEQPGSLPTALRFAEGAFKNGADPLSMFTTLTKGFGQMVPQPQYTTAQKYAVIQYIRETFLRPHNPSQFAEITPAYLASLPKALARAEAEKEDRSLPQYQRMDFGPALFWTYEVAPGNIAQKGIAVRLDDGPGGVSKGRAWMIYDHDTMRVAAATTGDFVDWNGIAFDGSHGTHTGLTGERQFTNPVGPGWASPAGKWDDDARIVGKDGKRYGPLPRDWARFEGMYLHGTRAVIAASIGGVRVLEAPGWLDYGATPVFTRTLNVEWEPTPLVIPMLVRVAPDSVNVHLTGDGALKREGGFWVASLKRGSKTRLYISRTDTASLAALAKADASSLDLAPLTLGGPRRWAQEATTTSEAGKTDGAFAADNFPLPVENPWQSWMRPGGFDFTPDGKGAVVATWNGDVWRVDGILSAAPAPLKWRRIATGLFQPLGVKFRGDDLFVTCRDQLVRLRDMNGDGETDFIECFNDDAQVTEHFHEFAMGLQTDAAGNFYYAKSGRHALDSVVPHHGTLLRVSADGSRTDILATGFRAANGVCLNDDGTFFVTDQEGFWTPKNRINRVKVGGFYGNIFGYTNVTDTSDSAMEQPMVWITNEKDRSPAELVWVPKNAWGKLGGSLLNLSYGTGRAFIVPHEEIAGQWQGAVCELPMPAFATGIMRGRFAADGALYTCGMFAWAGNATAPGGFHRIRRSAQPAHVPLAVHATKGALTVTFSDPLDPNSVQPDAFTFKIWALKRTKNYGSKHYDEHALTISAARLSEDKRTVALTIADLAPTQCYELTTKLRAPDGAAIERSLHGTILRLSDQ